MIGLGTILKGRHRIDLVLSQDPVNALYLATDLAHQTTVVVKSIASLELGRRAALLAVLFRDATVLSRFQTADLLPIIDLGVEPYSETPFLVLPYAEGRPVADMISPQGAESRTAAVFVEVARSLLDAHDQAYERGPGDEAEARSALASYDPMAAMVSAQTSGPRPGPIPELTFEDIPEVRATWVEAPLAAHTKRPPRKPRRRRRGKARTAKTAQTVAIISVLGLFVVGVVAMSDTSDDRSYGYMTEHAGGPRRQMGGEDDGYLEDLEKDLRVGRGSHVVVVSVPSGAQVMADLRVLGETPVRVARPPDGQVLELTITKAGFKDRQITVSSVSPMHVSARLWRTLTEDPMEKKSREQGMQWSDRVNSTKPVVPTRRAGVRLPSDTPTLGQ